jgi:hypothetical protein
MASVAGQQRIIEYNVPHYYKAPPPMSFREGSALEILGQKHRSDLNGKYVVCLGRDGMRTLVMTSTGDTLSITDTHMRIAELSIGTRVTLIGLSMNPELNGQFAILKRFEEAERLWIVSLEENPEAIHKVRAVNFVITPPGSEEPNQVNIGVGGKKRRLLVQMGPTDPSTGRPLLQGTPGLLSGHPIPGATARLIAIDASVALSSQQPILKRCGTLRKLVHGFPGFAQLVVCVVVKLHLDPSHPGRVLDQSDANEAVRIAKLFTDGKLDGIPRRELRELVAAGEVILGSVLAIADRYCGANHLVFAIDSNFAGLKETISNMVHQITSNGVTNVVAASSPPVQSVVPSAAADLLMQDVVPTEIPAVLEQPVIPLSAAVTSLMANRYAKPAIPSVEGEAMDTSPPKGVRHE